MDNSANSKKSHYIKFTTSEWGNNEYIFETSPILYCQDTGMDHLIQCRIVSYMEQHKIKGKDKKYVYYDNKMNEIMRNDTALEHATYKLPQKEQ